MSADDLSPIPDPLLAAVLRRAVPMQLHAAAFGR